MRRASISILKTTLAFNFGTVISWQLFDSISGDMASYAIFLCTALAANIAFNLRVKP